MAKKSVKEILEAARKGGPVKAGQVEPDAPPAPEESAEATAAAAPLAPSSPTSKPAAATPPPGPGRPLTLKEKMAAARQGAIPAAAKPAAPPASDVPGGDEPAASHVASATPADIPTPATLGRPLTLQEKMAAARAKGGAAGPASAMPAATATTAKAAATTTKPAAAKRALPPLSELSDPKDLAEALRQTASKKEAETAAAVKAKEPPPKPAREKETRPQSVLPRPSKGATLPGSSAAEATELRRRRFLALSGLSVVWVAWGAFVAGIGAFTAMLGRFMFPNVLAEPPSTIKVGVPQNYDPEAVNERFKAEWGFWIVRSTRYNGEDIIYALQSICTHLGCPPNWLEGEQKFKCPCHGSGFYISGVNFEGPAPRPLERFKVSLADDGQIIVDKSQKFQQELEQWKDSDSFITVV
jgi:cytochrome b6-f complex iron-sulfur subunit